MKRKFLLLLTIVATLSLMMTVSCKDKNPEEEEDNAAKAKYSIEKNYVDTVKLRLVDFKKQIITNGKLRAHKKSELRFLTSGEIAKIFVQNGQYVKAGEVLVELDRSSASIELVQSEHALKKARIDLADILIGFGYSSDTTTVPKDMLEIAKIRSGYNSSSMSYDLAKIKYENSQIKAPFAGKIANVKAKEYESTSDVFCTIIDDSRFEVEFHVLESEVAFIEVGQSVKVTSFVDQVTVFEGKVTQINPLIDSKGQINIKAQIANKENKLMEGMNVKIVIEKSMSNQMVVPKSSVVIRDNQNVLFRYNPDNGKAMWTYVDIIMSNSDSHVVAPNQAKNAQLNIGDWIIYTGNLNLANNSNVEIRKD